LEEENEIPSKSSDKKRLFTVTNMHFVLLGQRGANLALKMSATKEDKKIDVKF